jgi:polyvinyl alcohol dehydrogenase (cytochrome)
MPSRPCHARRCSVLPATRCGARRLALGALLCFLAAGFPPRAALATGWPSYAGGAERRFFNAAETQIDASNAGTLGVKWTFPTGGIITGSPAIVPIDLPGERGIRVAFFQSWDGNVYAVRVRDGRELWRFATTERSGVTFPATASVHVENVDGAPRVLIGSGQTCHALDAASGAELWRFDAGTACASAEGCGFAGERNEIESSAIVAGDLVLFGMDVNDQEGGKGGFYALDVRDGRLRWFFDLESGMTCTPNPDDVVRRYDGYHSEAELGLPAGFLATRPGCAHPRSRNGCGNVWSSPAFDAARGYVFFASSNCDTDANPATLRPAPPMPPYDEALVALGLDGRPAWRWRAREVDNDDLAYGGAPNLFTARIGGAPREVVGIGNKDGTYTVLDRDGRNELSGARWDDPDAAALPYWRTSVVAGGEAGGVLATAAVDETAGRVYFGTAPGSYADVLSPQRPTVHALDAGSGAIVWQNTGEPGADATFAPTSALPGVVFAGSIVGGSLRSYDAVTGVKLGSVTVGVALAAAPAVSDGTLLVGGGIGARSASPGDPSDQSSRIPHALTALCAPGTPACAADQPIAGRRLYVADSGSRRRIDLRAADDAIAPPATGSQGDPTRHGATLVVRNPATAEEVRVALPAAGWRTAQHAGEPPAARGFRYRDRTRASGPCFAADLSAGQLRVACGGADGFALVAPSQGALVVALELGRERVLCTRFGGRVDEDRGRARGGRGRFRAAGAPAPEWCSLP